MKKTCSACGEEKEEFCGECQDIIAEEDGLLTDTCTDCCQKQWQTHDPST